MKIETENQEYFDIPTDFEISIEETNPLLSEQGSSSLTVELPPSPKNLKILGYPHRADRKYKFRKKRKVQIESRSFVKQATLQIEETNTQENISGFFILNETHFYTRVKEITMPELFADKIFDGSGATTDQKINSWISYLTHIMTGDREDDFHVFPVLTKVYTKSVTQTERNEEKTYTIDYDVYEYLNAPAVATNGGDEARTATDRNGKEYYQLVGSEEWSSQDEDGAEITYPKGYGITPFLKYSYVLRSIFEYFGYELLPSLFDTDPAMKKIVLLNNTADAILKGKLDYSQLVPTVTVNDFLDSVRNDFACDFVLLDNGKQIEITFWNDVIDTPPDEDYTSSLSSEPVIQHADPQQIYLSAKRNLEFTDSNFKSYQEMVQAFGEPTHMEYLPNAFGINTPRPTPGFYYIANQNGFYEITPSGENWFEKKLIAYDTLDFYEKESDEISYYKKESTREHIPIINAALDNTHPVYNMRSHNYMPVPFIGERRHLNTTLKVTTTSEDNEKITSETIEKAETQDSCPIMACFHIGRGTIPESETSRNYHEKLFCGTTSMYNNAGKIWGNLSLTYYGNGGLYNRFWKKFDQIIQHSFDTLIVIPNLSPYQIMNLRMNRLKLIEGQPLIPQSIKYTVSGDRIEVVEMELRTIKLYE